MSDPARWYPPTGWDDPAAAASAQAQDGGVPGRSRLRSWLVLALLFGLAAVYCVGWGAYVDSRAVDHYRQLAPGQTTTINGLTVRAERIAVLEVFDAWGDDPQDPAPGAAWVEATVRVEGTPTVDYERCQFDLLGPDGRLWEPESSYDDSVISECGPELGSASVRLVYQVPAADLDAIMGVVIPPDGGIVKVSTVVRP